MRNLLKPRTFVVAAVAMLLSGGAYAFTASNVVPTTTAGNGSATISGYTVSGVSYTLSNSTSPGSATDPVITAVSFTLAPTTTCPTSGENTPNCTPNVVDAVITGTSSTHDYNNCTVTSASSGWTVACTLPSGGSAALATVSGAKSLAVTATDSNASTGSTL